MPEPLHKGKKASSGVQARLDEKETKLTFEPNRDEKLISKYRKRRVNEMQDFRKNLGIEARWREADEEYIPHELDFGTTRKRFETDQDTGLRSRMVPVGDASQQWRQASSAPTLLAKIQTAVGIIIDRQPEAQLVALVKKYSGTTDLAKALWKRNWQITDAKEKLKLVVFDLIKYGWKPQRTYPRTVKYSKRVLVSKDTENPENDKYEEKELTWFNDVDRQPLDVFTTWIDELTKPYDPFSMNECYYELDFSYDQAAVEFGHYPNWKYVKRDSQMVRTDEKSKGNRQNQTDRKTRKDIVTIGFFESRHKDLLEISVPKDNITIYHCPLPNDDGYLSLTQTLWLLRNSKLPYGVSLWEIIRQNKALYDKMKNMTMDQLVLSIMKFGFFAGTNTAVGDGKMEIVPGQARQLTSSTGKAEVNWMEIPGPGKDSFAGIEMIAKMMDDESGISPTLEGEITGKTLGEIMHAKEASLKRMKTPMENVEWLIEQDAYLTLSWMSQVYAIPTVVDFATEEEMRRFEKEEQIEHSQLFAPQEADGELGQSRQAHYLPQLALHLEDREGELKEGKESKFYQVGKDIEPNDMKWRGIFKVIPNSAMDSSMTVIKATKMEMFNVLMPLFQFPPELVAKAAEQICEVNEEDPKDWLPDSWIQYLEGLNNPEAQAAAQQGGQGGGSIFQPRGGQPQGPTQSPMTGQPMPMLPPEQSEGGQPAQGQPMQGMMPGAQPQTLQAGASMTPPQAQTVVPRGQINGPMGAAGALKAGKGLFGRTL